MSTAIGSSAQTQRPVRPREPGRPTQQAALQLREICLEAALAEFLAHGFEGATIDGIARHAKASRATVYRMFGNKDALFRAMHQWMLEGRQSNLRLLLARDLPPAEMLAAVIERIYLDCTQPRVVALARLFIAESHRFPELADSLFENFLFEPLIDYLETLSECGIAKIDDPVEAAWDLATLAGGGVRMLIAAPITDPQRLQARTQRLARLVTEGWLQFPNGGATSISKDG
ncbi:TetR/AcrR family transcriptional regulator [Pseudomonas citronellolis]|uniref:TetR/AcrR family transcriptional regulator n=1 Tax=Pseudomonas citronellolis TaxID=53408 RepID=UPI0021BF864A|nr:TetR/AcrR family transcriptional regulator [Pseudomonas citronellolis]UXJ50146.1 TetR/AcrR family transcriptional regulator [Pseudomonas citronellolis]